MQTFMIKYPIGIDIGVHYLAAAQLQKQGKGLAIRGLYHRELSEAADEAEQAAKGPLVSCLQEIVRDQHFSGRSVVLNIPSKNLSIFPLSVQTGKEETLEEAILRESEKYLPFPLEEAVIDYPCLTKETGTPGRYKVTIAAIRQSTISSYLALMEEAGLVVEAVDFSVSSLMRLHQHNGNLLQNPVILCHIGHTKTLLAAVTGEDILVQSDVTWGSRILIDRILADIDLSRDRDSARVLLDKYGLSFEGRFVAAGEKVAPPEEEMTDVRRTIFQIAAPYIDEIIYELHKVISYVHADKQNFVIDGLFLYGQAAGIKYLDSYLENRLGIATKIVNPLDNFLGKRPEISLRGTGEGMFALALGMALRRVPWL